MAVGVFADGHRVGEAAVAAVVAAVAMAVDKPSCAAAVTTVTRGDVGTQAAAADSAPETHLPLS